jgi:transcriptional antiterminator NusG
MDDFDTPNEHLSAPGDDAPVSQTTDAAATDSALPDWATVSPSPDSDEPEIDIDILRVDDAGDEGAPEIVEIVAVVEPAGALDLADAELLTVVDDDEDDDDLDDAPRELSPYDRPGDWFVVHTYAGYENKVKQNLASRVKSMNVEEQIYEVVIPMEDVIEFKGGRKVVVQKKVFGLSARAHGARRRLWYVVRNTPGVTALSGTPNDHPAVAQGSRVDLWRRRKSPARSARCGRFRVRGGRAGGWSRPVRRLQRRDSDIDVAVEAHGAGEHLGRETPVELERGQAKVSFKRCTREPVSRSQSE